MGVGARTPTRVAWINRTDAFTLWGKIVASVYMMKLKKLALEKMEKSEARKPIG